MTGIRIAEGLDGGAVMQVGGEGWIAFALVLRARVVLLSAFREKREVPPRRPIVSAGTQITCEEEATWELESSQVKTFLPNNLMRLRSL